MNYIKKTCVSLLYIIGILFILTFLLTIMNYFNIINGKMLSISKIIIIFLAMFIGGFVTGKKAKTKGWLEGIKLALITLLTSLLLNYLAFDRSFQIKNLLYDTILIISCMFGSMIGINLSSKKSNA